MEEHKILAGQEREHIDIARSSAKYEKVQMYLAWARTLACLVVCLVVVLAVFRYGKMLDSTMKEANAAITSVHQVTEQLEQADLSGVVQGLNGLMNTAGSTLEAAEGTLTAATATMDEAFGVLNELKLKELNKAIEDFGAVVEPLSRLFRR